jgi:hypothetical protein
LNLQTLSSGLVRRPATRIVALIDVVFPESEAGCVGFAIQEVMVLLPDKDICRIDRIR